MDEADREEALMNCLQIPDDDVKLAVVSCLYYVPISQINFNELKDLMNLI